jgi:cyclopropane-fatty-acyl-phospholipid synthase
VKVIKKDYRDLDGQYDRIVSIEMMEALGHEHVPVFMRKCRDLLRPDGTLCVQVITFPHDDFDKYLATSDFSREYIFPGGELISMGQLEREAKGNGLEIESVEKFAASYARTLRHWAENFLAVKDKVKELGFDERFCRKWLYYLISCEAAFEVGYVDDQQVLMRRRL